MALICNYKTWARCFIKSLLCLWSRTKFLELSFAGHNGALPPSVAANTLFWMTLYNLGNCRRGRTPSPGWVSTLVLQQFWVFLPRNIQPLVALVTQRIWSGGSGSWQHREADGTVVFIKGTVWVLRLFVCWPAFVCSLKTEGNLSLTGSESYT